MKKSRVFFSCFICKQTFSSLSIKKVQFIVCGQMVTLYAKNLIRLGHNLSAYSEQQVFYAIAFENNGTSTISSADVGPTFSFA